MVLRMNVAFAIGPASREHYIACAETRMFALDRASSSVCRTDLIPNNEHVVLVFLLPD